MISKVIDKVIGKVTSNVATVESLGSKLLINEPIVYSGQPVVIDVETDEKDNFVGGAITFDGSNVYYYSDWKMLEPIASQAQLIGHNLKGDCHWLKSWGAHITPNSLLADTMLMSYVSYATRESHGLKPLCKELLDIEWPSYKEMTGKGRGKKTLDMLPVEEVAEYCGMDCLGTFKLHEYFNKRMLPQQKTIYEQLEMPLSRLLWKIEDKGVMIDCSLLSKMDNHMEDEVMRIKEGIKQLTGKDFNPNSPKQKILLLNELGFKTKTSDKKFLIKHKDHPLIKLLLENSEMGKIHSSFIQAFLKIKTLPIIHTSFNQVSESKIDEDDAHGIATGRLSSKSPNLQQIPSRSENGKEIRKLFIPRNVEDVLIVADYSQIELRVAAHFSHDPILTNAFKTGEDVHEATAKALGVDRFYGKTGNFLLAFGGGPAKLMSALNIPEHKAVEFYNLYWARFHVLKQWKENVVSNARRLGGVQTIHGFWLSLPNLDYDKAYASASAMLDNVNAKRKAKEERLLSQHQLAKYIIGKAERMAVSGIVQGSAAYMIKKAMLKCNEIGYTPILTVHDELVFESTTRGVAEAETNIKQIMENIVKLDVPLEVVIGHGANWGEAKC